MAVTFDELKLMMEETGLKFMSDSDKEVIFLSASGLNGVYYLWLKLVEDGEGLLFRVSGLAMVKGDHPFKAKVLEILLVENHRLKIGRCCYDPIDGEVYLDWFLPLEDGLLTLQQLKRCVIVMLHYADNLAPRLHHLLKTGEDLPPEEISFRGILQHLLREGIQLGLLSENDEIRLRHLLSQVDEEEGDPTSE